MQEEGEGAVLRRRRVGADPPAEALLMFWPHHHHRRREGEDPDDSQRAGGEAPFSSLFSSPPRQQQTPDSRQPGERATQEGEPPRHSPADDHDENDNNVSNPQRSRQHPPRGGVGGGGSPSSSLSSPHRTSRLYFLFSFVLALAAVVAPPSSSSSKLSSRGAAANRGILPSDLYSHHHQHHASASQGGGVARDTNSAGGTVSSKGPKASSFKYSSSSPPDHQHDNKMVSWWFYLLAGENSSQHQQQQPSSAAAAQKDRPSNWLLDVLLFWDHRNQAEPETSTRTESHDDNDNRFTALCEKLLGMADPSRLVRGWNLEESEAVTWLRRRSSWLVKELVDPVLLQRPISPTALTDLLDKVLTSTLRLLALANLLLSWTYILHSAVADWFLDPAHYVGGAGVNTHPAGMAGLNNAFIDGIEPGTTADAFPLRADSNHHHHHSHRHHHHQPPNRLLGGFLLIKMLLVSAIVSPDTLDWMILLSWYTLLSFLRSLSRTCSNVTQRTGMLSWTHPPPSGVWQLLLVVLACDILAAAVCVALFHGAGLAMVMLLTCDCALLGVETITHLLEYVVQWLESHHAHQVQALEDEQQQPVAHDEAPAAVGGGAAPLGWGPIDPDVINAPPPSPLRLDPARAQRLELLEQQHSRRLQFLESTIFALQLLVQLLTCAHFSHIWFLHGVQFTLIDGVLALHLHSAVTLAGKKIQERRNLRRIARDLDGLFATATPQELRKAAAAGDVCCICLSSMSVNVKKVACGHFFHTPCLREVVERARSVEAARCPLCRSSVLDGSRNHQSPASTNAGQTSTTGARTPPPPRLDPPQPLRAAGVNGERSLFRFSTEEVFPDWLPIPAFAFEVVRRPSANAAAAGPPVPQQHEPRQAMEPMDLATAAVAQPQAHPAAPQTPERPSLLRQLLIMAGAVIPLTPEEEARALDHLGDMFPQYDRADLMRALRESGSPERVAEAVLTGNFVGAPRFGQDHVDGT